MKIAYNRLVRLNKIQKSLIFKAVLENIKSKNNY